MKTFLGSSKAWFLAALLVAPVAFAKEAGGVNFPEKVEAEGKSLSLLGAGVRMKLVFKVYAAALYAEQKTDAPALIAADQVKKVQLHLLRTVGKDKIIEAIREGFERNSKAAMESLKPRLAQFEAAIPDLKEHEVIDITYVPGKGTVLGGVAKATVIPGKDFADALFSVWLGKDPVDGSLKRELLGR